MSPDHIHSTPVILGCTKTIQNKNKLFHKRQNAGSSHLIVSVLRYSFRCCNINTSILRIWKSLKALNDIGLLLFRLLQTLCIHDWDFTHAHRELVNFGVDRSKRALELKTGNSFKSFDSYYKMYSFSSYA